MTKGRHAADIANDKLIESAVRFEIALFLGTGRFAKAEAFDVPSALQAAKDLRQANPACSRTPLIYAIAADGRSAIVNPKESTMPKSKPTPAAKAALPAPARARRAAATPKPQTVQAPAQGKRAAVLASAQAGTLPTPPDFSANTHARFRSKLAEVVALANAGDIDGLKAVKINPISSSPKAMDRYRNLCVIALEAKAAA